MLPGNCFSFRKSRQESSVGNWRLKSLIVYRRCFGMVCLTSLMMETVCHFFYLMSRDNYQVNANWRTQYVFGLALWRQLDKGAGEEISDRSSCYGLAALRASAADFINGR